MNAPTLRRVARSTRRIVDGGRGLGFTTTARWGIDQLTGGPPALVNTSLTWVRADTDTTTVVWINNYWSDAYGIECPHIEGELLGADGTTVATFAVDLAVDATVVLDTREILRDQGVSFPFDGQVLLQVRHERIVPNRPLQVFAEYRRDSGECSGVHGQYGLLATPAAQVVSAMRVEAGPDVRTGFIVTNAYDGAGNPRAMKTTLAVHAADGRVRSVHLPPVPARGTIVAYADELIPDLAAHLDGQPGHARIRLACPSSRIATFLESGPAQRRIVNHGTVDRIFDQENGIRPGWTASWPVASVCGRVDDRTDTVLAMPNVWGPVASDYVARIDVYRPDGSFVARHEQLIGRACFAEVGLRAIVGAEIGTIFHAEVSVRSPRADAERPHTFDLLVGVHVDGTLVAEAQVGAEFYNAAVPDGVRWMDIRRTRIFGRVDQREGRCTWIFLGFPVGQADAPGPTEPLLTLVSADGLRRSSTTITLPAHGCRQFAIDELFAEADAVLGPDGIGQLRVRDTEARLYGYSWVEHPTATTFPLDHLIGG